MANEFICQYGNCNVTGGKAELPIMVTDHDGMERSRFCCREHAALQLLRRAWQYEGNRKPEFVNSIQEKVAAELAN